MAPPLTRRRFLRESGAAALGLALLPPRRIEAAPAFDLLLKGGTLLDGTGGPAWSADVGIVGDAIVALGSIAPEQARRVLDVTGLQVAPGFIDIHSHSDGDILAYPNAESRVLQGVTTEVTGNCGFSAAPLTGVDAEERRRLWQEEEGVEADWTDVASYFRRLEETRVSVSQILLLGQGTLRSNAIGQIDRPLGPDEMKAVLRAVEEGMDQGAFEIGRRTGARVQISHLKAAGQPNWPKQGAALSLIEAGRRAGINVLADAYPYTAYSTA
jgi:N-acyl-D-aspartate/D-glutamate deacylase